MIDLSDGQLLIVELLVQIVNEVVGLFDALLMFTEFGLKTCK
jgi:hypothetical protein